MPARLVYRDLRPLTQAEALEKLANREPENVAEALVAIGLHEESYEFAAETIMREGGEKDRVIRGAALVALAHLARVHRNIPDEAIDLVRAGLKDSDEYIRGQAQTALDDIEQFVPEKAIQLRG